MKLPAKELAKVRQLHGEIMAIADQHEMSMDELIDMAVEGESDEEMDMEDEAMPMDAEEEEKPMDKAKIALIVGRMRGHKGE